jgi:site-specific DNA-methyltransferase (adenine-specific)
MREDAGAVDQTIGRWPANVVLDESQAAALDQQSGQFSGVASGMRQVEGPVTFTVGEPIPPKRFERGVTDFGGASRFFYVAKADSAERPRINGTSHPTVKPLALMRWLVRLVCPPGGTVLEPFAGSGATVEACVLEGFRCIAIERETDYLPLITSRLNQGTFDFGEELA